MKKTNVTYPLEAFGAVKRLDDFSGRVVIPIGHEKNLVIVVVDPTLQRVAGRVDN